MTETPQAPQQPAPAPAPVPAGEGKDWLTTLLLCIFVGNLGVHRFYVGKTGSGVLWLLTLGICGIGTLVDLVMIIMGNFKDANGQDLVKK